MAETVTEETTETVVKTEPQAVAPSKTLDELAAENARMQVALKEANKEAADRRKKLEAFEKAEDDRKKAALSETERLRQELTTSQAQLEAAKRTELQRSVADEVKLPAVFATRIQGADREAMLADAKVMLEALPKASAAQLNATNPGAGATGENDEQRRKRLGLR